MTNNTAVKKDKLLYHQKNQAKTTADKVEITLTDELIIGICSPIGSDSEIVINEIIDRLKKYKYKVCCIKVSDFIKEYYEKKLEKKLGVAESYSKLLHKIKGGDELRKNYKSNSILIELAIKKIREDREEKKTTDVKSKRICYIIDSIKNHEELKLLRLIYGNIFYLFSIFSPENERKENLKNKGLAPKEIKDIISQDEYENDKHGQNVRDTFKNGDIFIRFSQENKGELSKKIERYMHLIFDTKIITPNNHEVAMYNAKSSAGNSACLSRQVGATITDEEGIVIASGWNDVPKFGGNLYKDEDLERCKDLKYCSNIKHRTEILETIEEKLRNKENINIDVEEVMNIIKNSDFKNIIEYSRAIHAEMHAIIIGSQTTSKKMVGGNLYCTTYPCHNCIRHIILAGIKIIYYIEPYKKSLGIKLHNDALTEDEKDETKVRIIPYDGVSPRKYLDLFLINKERKSKDGKIVEIDIENAIPKNRASLQAIPTLENQAILALEECGLLKGEINNEK